MVRPSPKALRFAEDATRAFIEGGAFRGRPRVVWDDWIAAGESRAPAADGTVDVPDPVAELLTSAVEQRIAEMTRQFDREADPDLGNDLVFLHVVLRALRRDDERAEA